MGEADGRDVPSTCCSTRVLAVLVRVLRFARLTTVMDNSSRLGKILVGMNRALGESELDVP